MVINHDYTDAQTYQCLNCCEHIQNFGEIFLCAFCSGYIHQKCLDVDLTIDQVRSALSLNCGFTITCRGCLESIERKRQLIVLKLIVAEKLKIRDTLRSCITAIQHRGTAISSRESALDLPALTTSDHQEPKFEPLHSDQVSSQNIIGLHHVTSSQESPRDHLGHNILEQSSLCKICHFAKIYKNDTGYYAEKPRRTIMCWLNFLSMIALFTHIDWKRRKKNSYHQICDVCSTEHAEFNINWIHPLATASKFGIHTIRTRFKRIWNSGYD